MKYLFWLLCPIFLEAQFDPKIEEYKHYSIYRNKDTIRYHVYSKGNLDNKNNLLIYFHGSGPGPLFNIIIKRDTQKVEVNGQIKNKVLESRYISSSVPFDLERIPKDYAFILISKKGVPFSLDREQYEPSEDFYKFEGLDYRVWQGDLVIQHLIKNHVKRPKKVVLIGHSEGSDVVAKLGHTNKSITHIGFWAGGGPTQYYDFALDIRKQVWEGKISSKVGFEKLDSLLMEVKSITKDKNNINKEWLGNSYRRWAQFTEPCIDNLLKIKVPIFVAVAGKDQAVPIESSLLIPVEFARLNRKNLTFKVYPDYNHSFAIEEGSDPQFWKYEFMKVFEDFMEWVESITN